MSTSKPKVQRVTKAMMTRANERLSEIEQSSFCTLSEEVYPTVKKNLTDDPVKPLSDYYRGITKNISHRDIDVIIAKLRAADKLCEAAKNIRMTIATDNEVWESHIEQLRKAIAEYEEEK